ncbi:MarR family transcriptional regulator (plasmid) [Deinococcus psychrotolerans]|uniref:MarR family transcriptional regulator n=1 Tax=Deinococcus psychrotolerans TaxID=2489213 RepID=A0A3G8YUU0_9DEIO|nr:MarR family transcriptional regulator [Deinococcus psychrotolerans]AZI44986.1 MarR family transcriptional regulator [Deinococcus psychrotolerans]
MTGGITGQAGAPADHETRLSQGDHQAIKLWLRLLTTTTLIETDLRARLGQHSDISLPRFDLLAQLARQPDGLRMSDLSARLMVTRGNVTRLADQLEREGLVQRCGGPDRRGVTLQLTRLGQERFGEVASTHEDWVVQLLDALSGPEQEHLSQLLGKIKTQINTRRSIPGG